MGMALESRFATGRHLDECATAAPMFQHKVLVTISTVHGKRNVWDLSRLSNQKSRQGPRVQGHFQGKSKIT